MGGGIVFKLYTGQLDRITMSIMMAMIHYIGALPREFFENLRSLDAILACFQLTIPIKFSLKIQLTIIFLAKIQFQLAFLAIFHLPINSVTPFTAHTQKFASFHSLSSHLLMAANLGYFRHF